MARKLVNNFNDHKKEDDIQEIGPDVEAVPPKPQPTPPKAQPTPELEEGVEDEDEGISLSATTKVFNKYKVLFQIKKGENQGAFPQIRGDQFTSFAFRNGDYGMQMAVTPRKINKKKNSKKVVHTAVMPWVVMGASIISLFTFFFLK